MHVEKDGENSTQKKQNIPIHILRQLIKQKKEQVELKRERMQNLKQDFGYVRETFTAERKKELTEYHNIFQAFAEKLKYNLRVDYENITKVDTCNFIY